MSKLLSEHSSSHKVSDFPDDGADLKKLGYKQELRRTLGLFSSFGVQFSMIAVGSTLFLALLLGLSVFGPAMIWAWIAGGVLQLILGAVIAQLVSAYPVAGGIYQVIGRLTGRKASAWQAGWMIAFAHIISLPQLAVGLVPYLAGWFGITLHGNLQVMLWSVGLMVLVTAINLLSVKIASHLNNIALVAELVGTALVIVALLTVHHPTHPLSYLTSSGGTVVHGSWIGPFLLALLLPGFMISSFDSAGNASEETVGASRTAPRGLMLANSTSVGIATVLIGLLLLGIQNLPAVMGSSEPMKVILDSTVGTTVTGVFTVLAMAALFGCMIVMQLTAARILFAQARDNQLPVARWFRKLNREGVPANATIVTGVLGIGFVFWSSAYAILAEMAGLAWALGYAAAAIAGVWALHTKRLPNSPWNCGRFTVPVFWIGALWETALCALFIWQDPLHIGLGMAAVIAVGMLVYACIPARPGAAAAPDGDKKVSPERSLESL
jgi:amino acid transporter